MGVLFSINPLTVRFFIKFEQYLFKKKKKIEDSEEVNSNHIPREEHDFLSRVVNSATMETNHEDMNNYTYNLVNHL